MKFTKKQKKEIYEQFPGIGELIINLGMNRMVQAPIHLGRNGKWYRGEKELNEWLTDIIGEIIFEEGGK